MARKSCYNTMATVECVGGLILEREPVHHSFPKGKSQLCQASSHVRVLERLVGRVEDVADMPQAHCMAASFGDGPFHVKHRQKRRMEHAHEMPEPL